MRRIAAGRAESTLRRLRGAAPGDPGFADAIHGARKDLKKLRTVVRLLREELGADRAVENRCYRDAGRALSGSRDAEVKLQTLDALGERRPDLAGESLSAWREALRAERDGALEGSDEIAVFEAIGPIEAGRDRIAAWELELDGGRLIERGVRRAYARGREAMRAVEDEPSEANLHEWRKRAKDLWYALRLLHGAWPELIGPTAEQAHALADLLGDHHDLALLREDLAARSFSAEAGEALAEAIEDRQRELAAAALDLGRRLYAEKPKAFARRLRRYWTAWRPPNT
jgi:CHAD domain-containing protein